MGAARGIRALFTGVHIPPKSSPLFTLYLDEITSLPGRRSAFVLGDFLDTAIF